MYYNISKVSIPFKRETPSKHARLCLGRSFTGMRFNSLQTGNSIQTSSQPEGDGSLAVCFNSLQTGNSIQTRRRLHLLIDLIRVSIPFKRETPSKLLSVKQKQVRYLICFNSLQTGNSIQTGRHRRIGTR